MILTALFIRTSLAFPVAPLLPDPGALPGAATPVATPEAQLARVPMDLLPVLQHAKDVGPAPRDRVLSIAVSLPYAHPEAIQAFVDSVSDPRSHNYRQFITPEEVGRRFGAPADQVDGVAAYLRNQGFTINLVSRNRLAVLATTTVAKAELAFHTTLHEYTLVPQDQFEPDHFIAYATPILLPAELASSVIHVSGLETYTHPRPGVTLLTPALTRGLYDTANLFSGGFTGAGRTVGVSNYDGFRAADYLNFISHFNLPVPPAGAGTNVMVVPVAGGGDGAGPAYGEGDIDIQMELGMAPLASIRVYDANGYDPIDVLTQETNDNLCDVISESWGWIMPSAYALACHNQHLSMNAQGITYMAATGDSGTTIEPYSYPDYEPEVLAVGGTAADVDGTTGARISEVGWSGSGGGWSTNSATFNVRPAWQTGTGVPPITQLNNYRLVPDVAFHAHGSGTGGAYYFYTGGALQNGWGGTSFSSPILAGMLTVVEQKLVSLGAAGRFGRIQDLIYSQNGRPDVWYDITSGGNGTLPDGSNSACTAGWDSVTGWGPMDCAAFAATIPVPTALTSLASVPLHGGQSNGSSYFPTITPDGRYVAFYSTASNLVPGDTNGVVDVFVYETDDPWIWRVSVDSNGVQGNGDSANPSISADGRYVAFYSAANNLVPGDGNGVNDCFVYDRTTGVTERVSVNSAGTEGNGGSAYPSISADGRFVTFYSVATNLDPRANNGLTQIFLRDRQNNVTTAVSINASGVCANNYCYLPVISGNGRYVTFWTQASNLGPADNNLYDDVYVKDLQTGVFTLVSVDPSGQPGNNESIYGSISADGRYVSFWSTATNLVPGDTNGTADVFVRDLQSGVTRRASVDSQGTQGNGMSTYSSLSPDGRFVAFQSSATNLVPGDTNGTTDVFLHDMVTGVTTRESVDSFGEQASGATYATLGYGLGVVSSNARFITFSSDATNLVPADSNGCTDVFFRDRWPFPPSISSISPTHGPNSGTSGVVIAGSHFTGTTSVVFGADSASYTVDNDGQITASLGATSTTGFVDVSVTNGNSAVTSPSAFDYFVPPTTIGAPCGAPSLTWQGSPTLGETFTLVTQGLGGLSQVMLIDWSNINPTRNLTFASPSSCIAPPCPRYVRADTLQALGNNSTFDLAIPNDPNLIGVHLRVQAVISGCPRLSTQALDAVIGL